MPQTRELEALDPPPPLFDRINVLTLEESTPQEKIAAIVNRSGDRLAATLRATYYGEALDPRTTDALDFTLGAKTLVDLEGRFDVTDNIRSRSARRTSSTSTRTRSRRVATRPVTRRSRTTRRSDGRAGSSTGGFSLDF